MKKIVSLFVLTQLLFACSSDILDEANDIAETLNADELSSSAENYKGVFTTIDGSLRGVLNVSLSLEETFATGTLTLSSGEEVILMSSNIIDNGNETSISFTEGDVNFVLNTREEGEVVEINNVTYRDLEGSLLVSQNTNRAPVTPITGTYECIDCGGSIDNMGTQTFNLMFTEADGVSSISSQTTLGMTVFNGIGVQTTCSDNGIETTCTIVSGDGVSNLAFEAGGGPVTWSGSHTFNNEPTGINDCSGVTGTWSWESPSIGTVGGTFVSDVSCDNGISVELYSEDFQTFLGTGFAPMPEVGQLDSDIIIVDGFTGDLDYGDTQDEDDFARGLRTEGVGTGGIYAFDVDEAGDIALGVQPGGNDFTPGVIDIRIENTTGSSLNSFTINYDLLVNNDQDRSNSLNFSYSSDNITFIPVSSLDFTSPEERDETSMGFVGTSQTAGFNITVADGSFIYLRFEGNDVGGSGSRDEFAIDNIVLEGN